MAWLSEEDRWTGSVILLFLLKLSQNADSRTRTGYATQSDQRAVAAEVREQEQQQLASTPSQQQSEMSSSAAPPPVQDQGSASQQRLPQGQQQRPPTQQQGQQPQQRQGQQQVARPPTQQEQGQPQQGQARRPPSQQQPQQGQQQGQQRPVQAVQGQQQRPPSQQGQRPPAQQGQQQGQQRSPSQPGQPPRQRVQGTAASNQAQQRPMRQPQQPQSQQRRPLVKKAPPSRLDALRKPLPLALLSGGGLAVGALVVWGVLRVLRGKRESKREADEMAAKGIVAGPCSKVKPTKKCVPLADGSACVIRREIPADNSCLFNAIGYVMHGSKTKASFLRSVVAREVSSDPTEYSDAFLGMSNTAYCNWIMQPMNWGGGIELSILSRHYGREIAAWNIESKKPSVFGEEQGYKHQVMVLYSGTHYDALVIAKHPKAPESEDKVEFNPRTKSGKMAIAAAQKLTELCHRASPFYRPPAIAKLKCNECQTVCKGQREAELHAKKTGHKKFDQMS